jgi:hypothetical protein
MKARIDAGTDVAMIGAWDEGQGAQALPTQPYPQLMKTLEADSKLGGLFLILTGADGGGPIDVYIDEAVPHPLRKRLRRFKSEFLVCVPSGRLVIGGAEDYRSAQPRITDAASVVEIAAGDYALRCYCIRDAEDDGADIPSQDELRAAVGDDDYRYYRKLENLSLRGLLILLAFPALAYFFGWIVALFATLLPLGVYAHVQERLRNSDARYQRIAQSINESCKQSWAKGTPTFAFEMRRLADRGTLTGGIIELDALPNAAGQER